MSDPISDDCSSNLHDYCTPCECACHDKTFLNYNELKTLYRLLFHQYISYENPEAINLVRKIRTLIGEDE